MILTLMEVVIMGHRERLRNSWSLLICLLFFSSCESPKGVKTLFANADTLFLKSSKGIYRHKGRPFTGVVFVLGQTVTDTLSIQKFLNGKKHGLWFRYDSNKTLREKRMYQHGKKEGVHVRYWPNGKIQLRFNLKNDVYHGNNKTWNDKGVLISDRNFIDGQESGLQRVWYDDGSIKSNFIIKNNRRYGLLGTKNCINVSDSIF